ncbi:MAG: preprotein translocase subunit SecE [Phormidesmis priestleyi Ana]|uniref:Protein translocase subunit SecE n=1 Tax=Phormidesmis priestleyi Ana TaxID=1666911 RepID=A0A0N8KNF5_9CYAN|nr:MAG: preprotein translocase subunit SecE [Phormidesmis priestleyi Ana]
MAKKDAKRAPIQDGAKDSSNGLAQGQVKGPMKGQSKESKGSQAGAGNSDGFSAGAFVEGTREELTKVIWPTRQQLISESAAVILMVGLSATLIYFVDKLFGWASRQVF